MMNSEEFQSLDSAIIALSMNIPPEYREYVIPGSLKDESGSRSRKKGNNTQAPEIDLLRYQLVILPHM
jgi:hypothetical protein